MRDDLMCAAESSGKFIGRKERKTIPIDRMRKLLGLSIEITDVLRQNKLEEHKIGVVMGYLDSQLRGV